MEFRPGAPGEGARQIALADRLVVAKSDLLPQDERALRLAELEAVLRALNPSAPILDSAAAEFGPAEFLADARAPNLPAPADRSRLASDREPFSPWDKMAGESRPDEGQRPDSMKKDHEVQSFAFRSAGPIDPGAFATF